MPFDISINKIAETNQKSNPRETADIKSNDNINEKEEELDFSKEKDKDTAVLEERNKTYKPQPSVEESEIKKTFATTPIGETSDDVKNGNDDIKHKTANVPVSPNHEDSDYEDNIVVTVPSASDTRTEKYLNRHHNSNPKPPGIEQSSPKSKNQVIDIISYIIIKIDIYIFYVKLFYK